MLYRAFPFSVKFFLTEKSSAAIFNTLSFAALTLYSFSVEPPDIYSPFHRYLNIIKTKKVFIPIERTKTIVYVLPPCFALTSQPKPYEVQSYSHAITCIHVSAYFFSTLPLCRPSSLVNNRSFSPTGTLFRLFPQILFCSKGLSMT